MLLLGLFLAVVALPVTDGNDTGERRLTETFQENENTETEKDELERKLENLLENVENVGDVQVILMTGGNQEKTGFYSSGEKKVNGVLIAAQGADSPVTIQNIQQAVMALFQIEAHKIKIMKMK